MSNARYARAAVVAVSACAGVAFLAGCRPAPAGAGDPTAGVVTAAYWAAWVLAVYLSIGFAVAAAAHLPAARVALGPVARQVTPQAIRALADLVVGAGAAAAVVASVAPATAFADGGHPQPSAVRTAPPSLDWPGLTAPTPAARVGLVAGRPTRPGAAIADDVVVVRRGDSLWSLAARRLGPGAGDAAVAAAWPRLYAANRAVIGADPDLIHPGQRLRSPSAAPREQR